MTETILKFIDVTQNNGEKYKVPYWKINSGIPGPVVLVTGAMHGNEIQSSEIIRGFKEIAEKKLKTGSCILMPFTNPIAVRKRKAHIDFKTGQSYSSDRLNNLNCSWPGKIDGTDTQQLAYAIFNSGIIQEATHCFDLHCWQSMRATTVIPRLDIPESIAIAKASRLPFMQHKPKTKQKSDFPCILSDYFCNSNRIGLCIEFSGQFLIYNKVVELANIAVCNMFKYLDMLEGRLEGAPEYPIVINEHKSSDIVAPASGLFIKSDYQLGRIIKKGELLGHIFDENNLQKYDISAPISGWLFKHARQQDSLLYTDPLIAYHVYADKGEVIATIIKN